MLSVRAMRPPRLLSWDRAGSPLGGPEATDARRTAPPPEHPAPSPATIKSIAQPPSTQAPHFTNLFGGNRLGRLGVGGRRAAPPSCNRTLSFQICQSIQPRNYPHVPEHPSQPTRLPLSGYAAF